MRIPSALAAALLLLTSPALAAPQVAETRLRVHVQGAVKAPGLYRLPVGSRVADGVQAAGGPKRGAALNSLDLAGLLADGQTIDLPLESDLRSPGPEPIGPPRPPRRPPAARPAAPSGPLSLNGATAAQLDALPGVGPGLARTLVAERARRGGFKRLEELREIRGIGAKRYAKLSRLLRVP